MGWGLWRSGASDAVMVMGIMDDGMETRIRM